MCHLKKFSLIIRNDQFRVPSMLKTITRRLVEAVGTLGCAKDEILRTHVVKGGGTKQTANSGNQCLPPRIGFTHGIPLWYSLVVQPWNVLEENEKITKEGSDRQASEARERLFPEAIPRVNEIDIWGLTLTLRFLASGACTNGSIKETCVIT
jgi:hypothetical protein